VGVLGVEVRRLAGGPDLGGDLAEAATGQLLAVDLGQLAGGLLLLGGGPVDRRAVLGAHVVALAHALGGVVDLEELLHQVGVGDDGGVEDDAHGLGVPGAAAADLLVGRVRRAATGVADRGGPDAGELPVDLLGAPEAAEAQDGDLEAGRHVVGDDRRVQHQVLAEVPHRLRAAPQCLVGGGQGGGLPESEHAPILPGHASAGRASRVTAAERLGGLVVVVPPMCSQAAPEDRGRVRAPPPKGSCSCRQARHVVRCAGSSLLSSSGSWSGAA